MLVGERRELLLSRLASTGKIVAKDLASELGVSEDSVRRDLRDLAAAGLCQRVYGGALPVSPAAGDYTARSTVSVPGKELVATRAVQLVWPGATILIDGGTTALALTRALPLDLRGTVITHSPTVAASLLDHPNLEVFVLGGRLFKHSAVTCGAVAVEAAATVHADLFFLGVTGVHPTAGLTTNDVEEAAMKRALAHRAADTYVMASAEKIGAASRFTVLPLDGVAGIITDAPPGDPTLSQLSALGVPLIFAH